MPNKKIQFTTVAFAAAVSVWFAFFGSPQAEQTENTAAAIIAEFEKNISYHPSKEWRNYYYKNAADLRALAGMDCFDFNTEDKSALADCRNMYYGVLVQNF